MSIQNGPSDKTEDPLLCPGCGSLLKEVYAEANYGRYLLLDQCPDCGGIWFDSWELYYLKSEEADQLDPVDREKLLSLASLRKGSGECPRCETELEPFQDPVLPKDARIEHCTKCNGLWLNRGELHHYAEHKSGLIVKQKSAHATQPAAAPASKDGNEKMEALKNLGQALSTRVSPEIDEPMNLDDTELDRSELAKDLIPVVIQALLRLFLKI
jgi:Zn-finger nucleic acid-binding protein